MTKEPLTVGQVEDIFRRMLPDFLKDDEVQRIAEQVFNRLKDKTPYAPASHTHAVTSLQGTQELVQGLSKEGHRHQTADIDGLLKLIEAVVSTVKLPTDYANRNHKHTFEEVYGSLPISRLVDGNKLLLALKTVDELKNHDHADLRKEIAALQKRVDESPAPKEYDDIGIRNDLAALAKRVDGLLTRAPQPVDVTITPIAAPVIVCDADYLILKTRPAETRATDADGKEGTVKITARGDRYLVRAEFTTQPTLPVTFLFSPLLPPPAICGIGSTSSNDPTT